MSKTDNLFLRSLLILDGNQVTWVTARDKDIIPSTRWYYTCYSFSVNRELNFEQLSVPKLEGAVVRDSHKLSIIQLDHLIDTRVVLFDTLNRLELDSLISVLDHKLVVIFYLGVCFPDEVNWLATKHWNGTINRVFVRVVAKYFDL